MTARLRDAGLALWLVGAALLLFLPRSPDVPVGSLDAAWALGLMEATVRGLAFGRELIFTHGPYLGVYVGAFHPGIQALTWMACVYLGLSYAGALLLLLWSAPQRWNLALLALLCGAATALRDPVLMSMPLVAAIGMAHLAGLRSRWHLPITVGLFAPLGLLPLAKGSVAIFCASTVVLTVAFLLIRRRRALALTCVLAPVASTLLFWSVSGQQVADLPGYFVHMLPLISGYTEAMSLGGDHWRALAFVVISAVLLWAVLNDGHRWRDTGLVRLYLFSVFGLFLFVSFKGIYGRHDLGPGLTGGATLLVAALLLRSASERRRFWPALLVTVLGIATIDRLGSTAPALLGIDQLGESYRQVLGDVQSGWRDPDRSQRRFDAALASLKAATPLPKLSGSVDLYPTDQGALIASGNRWNPRPVLQSYSAYTPLLAELNRRHLIGAVAPDHLFFKVEPIDEHMPSLDDGPSWPTILRRYRPVAMQGEYLVLDRRADAEPAAMPLAALSDAPIAMSEQRLGEWVDIPTDRGALMVQMDIHPTLYGRLALLLFKSSPLRIDLELADGTRLNYRLVSTMARAGFLLTPLVRDSTGFAQLYGDPALLAANRVRRLRVQPMGGPDRLWRSRFGIGFSAVVLPKPIDLSALLRAGRSFAAPAELEVIDAARCDGSIDLLNRGAPQRPPAVNGSGRWLTAAGWLAQSIEPGTVPEQTYLMFEAADGTRRFAATRSSARPDVAASFGRPGLTMAGWEARVDTAGLQGSYELGVAYRDGRYIQVCPESRVQIDVHPDSTVTAR